LDAVKEWVYNPNRNEAEPISTTELSELLGITKASVTRSINKLCKSNLVEFEIVYIGKENKMLLKTTEPF
jgi:Mn-dependent DtxR family transcriptional regulator